MAWKHEFDEEWKGIKPRSLRWFLCSMNKTLNVAARSRPLSHSQILSQSCRVILPNPLVPLCMDRVSLCRNPPSPGWCGGVCRGRNVLPFPCTASLWVRHELRVGKGWDGSAREGLDEWGKFRVGGGSTWQLIQNLASDNRWEGSIFNFFVRVAGTVANSEPSLPKLKEGCHLMITSSNSCCTTNLSCLRGIKLIPSRAACFNL